MICCWSKNIEKRYAGILKMFVFNGEQLINTGKHIPNNHCLTEMQRQSHRKKPTKSWSLSYGSHPLNRDSFATLLDNHPFYLKFSDFFCNHFLNYSS
jgi:hypothetical protein